MTIIFNLQGMVDQASQNPYTRIGQEVCAAQVIRVWKEVSKFIQDQLCHGRGVRIPNLLKVTYKLHKSEVAQKNVIVNRIPLMMISVDVAKKYYITSKKPAFNLDLPEVPLNLSTLAINTCLPRSVVETCVQEVIQAYHRALVLDNHVEFHLCGIGRLIVESRNSYATFCTEFMNKYEFERPRNKDKACAF
jgi:hypothetical protein